MSEQQLQAGRTETLNVNEIDLAHLAGVFDGTGSVTVEISKAGYGIGYSYKPILQISMPKTCESELLLGKLTEFCENNNIKYSIAGSGGSWSWKCKDKTSIELFLELLLPHIIAQYENSIVMLEQVLPRIEDGLHTEKEGFYELVKLADELRSTNQAKYDQEYFEEAWSITE